MTVVVHILFLGYPLCRFLDTVPGEWPPGHTWVSMHESDAATCKVCRRKHMEMKKER